MYRKHKTETILRILLMPFIDESFSENDILFKIANEYKSIITTKRENKKYEVFKKDLLNLFSNDFRIQHLDDVGLIAEMFYPVSEMSEFIEDSVTNSNRYYLSQIYKITSSFITLRDGIISIKNWNVTNDIFRNHTIYNKIELWNNLIRIASPDLFIAAYYAFENIEINYLYNVPSNILLSDKLLNNILVKGIAETHMHFNAGFSYQQVWSAAMNFSINYQNNCRNGIDHKVFYLSLFRFHFAQYIEYLQKHESNDSFLDYIYSKYNNEIARKLVSTMHASLKTSFEKSFSFRDEEIDIILKEYTDLKYENRFSGDILEKTIYLELSYLNTSSEIIFLYKALSYLISNTNHKFELNLFMNYVRVKNRYFDNKMQSNKIGGLNFFQAFFHTASSSTYFNGLSEKYAKLIQDSVYLSIFKEQCSNRNLKKLEIKISPPVLNVFSFHDNKKLDIKLKIKQQILSIFEQYNVYCSNMEKDQKIKSVPTIGIVYHFIKTLSPDNFSGKTCWISFDRNIVTDSNSYQLMQYKYIDFTTNLNELIREHPILSEYIVGIDAASIENNSEPWVFAPVFKNTRKRSNTVPFNHDTMKPLQNIGFTYHVGEDFRHIVSGLRHIYEVVEFFGYRSGDRLGHAIALGLDVERWVNSNSVVCLPIGEYLDNLLWIWGTVSNKEVSYVYENIETKIMQCAEEIYGKKYINHLSPYVLWKAYLEKFNGLSLEKIEEIIREESQREANQESRSNNCIFLNTENHTLTINNLLCTHFCPSYYEQYKKPIFVNIEANEIGLIQEIQKLLIKKIENIGIYVEVNPTSNIAIGDFEGLPAHPVLHLNSNGLLKESDNAVMVTINSDDPVIFNTNVENEISLVYHSFINHGFRREDVLKWIDKVRENGVNSSFIKEEKDFNTLKKDIENIISICKS